MDTCARTEEKPLGANSQKGNDNLSLITAMNILHSDKNLNEL